jgi:hypothetical protein
MTTAEPYIYAQADCPGNIRDQIIRMLKREWPQTFAENKPEWPTESPEMKPMSLVLMIDGLTVSHCLIMRKIISSEKARRNRDRILSEPIRLELGEGKLW